jgi:protein SCO1
MHAATDDRRQTQLWLFTACAVVSRVELMRPRGACAAHAAGICFLALMCACSRTRQYELHGQVLAVDSVRNEITVKHEDIKGFMPGMTMPFKVRDASLVAGRTPGELIRATLVVEDAAAYLKAIERTGVAPLTEVPTPRGVLTPLDPGDPIPDAVFMDQDGRRRRLVDSRGQALAVTFIYTRCPVPDFCPFMDRQFAAIQKAVAEDASLRGRVHLMSISFDPTFDTPAVLKQHAAMRGADPRIWSFLTGDRDEIDRFAGHFGVSITREGANLPEIMHNLRTAVVDTNGRLSQVLSGNDWKAEKLLEALRSAGAAR